MKAKTKFTRLWSILLALAIVVGMLPTVVLAAGSATATADFVSDPTTALTLLNAAKTGDTDSTWDGDTKTLTLGGVNFVTSAATAVKLPDDAKIVLNGENTIKGGDSSSEHCYGIYGEGDLTISGTGTLNVTGGEAGGSSLSFGIHAEANVTINSGTVTATGGEAPGNQSLGIRALNGNLTINGGTVTATGSDAKNSSNGLWAGNGSVTISGGKVVANGGGASSGTSSGIYAKNVEINNTGTIVTATGGTAQHGTSYGINAVSGGTVTFSGGTLTAATKGDSCINGTFNAAGKTISFDSNDGVGNMMAKTTATEYTLPANGFTPPAGMQLKGWSVNGTEKAVGDTITVTDGTTVKAVWENITYTVSFDANGGTGTMADLTGVLGEYTLPANGFTAPTGMKFKCWSVDGVEKAVGDKITVSANTTVKAVWENITYTVTFDANGGTGTMADVTGISGEYTLPSNGFTAPEGKQFKAWSVDGNEKAVGDKITVTADTTVKAVWETLPVTPSEYDILDGANSKWTQDSDGNLSVRGSGAFSEFVGVKVDGKLVDEKYYTVKEGSTIVTLKADYLNTCTVGSHTLEIIWTDGSASTAFTVSAQTVVEPPQTGDNSMMWIWIALLVVSGIGVMGTIIYIRKKKHSGK